MKRSQPTIRSSEVRQGRDMKSWILGIAVVTASCITTLPAQRGGGASEPAKKRSEEQAPRGRESRRAAMMERWQEMRGQLRSERGSQSPRAFGGGMRRGGARGWQGPFGRMGVERRAPEKDQDRRKGEHDGRKGGEHDRRKSGEKSARSTQGKPSSRRGSQWGAWMRRRGMQRGGMQRGGMQQRGSQARGRMLRGMMQRRQRGGAVQRFMQMRRGAMGMRRGAMQMRRGSMSPRGPWGPRSRSSSRSSSLRLLMRRRAAMRMRGPASRGASQRRGRSSKRSSSQSRRTSRGQRRGHRRGHKSAERSRKGRRSSRRRGARSRRGQEV